MLVIYQKYKLKTVQSLIEYWRKNRMEIKLETPLTEEKILNLKAGDSVLLSGVIYSARDAAHKRLIDLLNEGRELPLNIKDETIYYVGPSPAKPGMVIGSAGPTTSYRMDDYAPTLMDLGLRGMIGKGARNEEVIDAIKRNKAVYFGAIGGAAALIAKSIIKSEIIAYEDLGAEAIRKMEIKDMPLVVIIDADGNNLYKLGQQEYLNSIK
jgi:fumarate hydratase subunit beta